MATTKRRITINLGEDEYAALARLSAANGESMSRIVAELVEAAAPALERVSEVIEAAAAAKEGFPARLRASFEEADRVMAPLLLAGQEVFDQATGRLIEAADGRDPRLSNDGGKTS